MDAVATRQVSKSLVRSFSDDLERRPGPRTHLETALIMHEAEDSAAERDAWEWKRFISQPESIRSSVPEDQKALFESSQRLLAAWDKFIKKLPPDQRINLDKKPNLATLQDAVKDAQDSWVHRRKSTKTGRVEGFFAGFIQRASDFEGLFSIIPSDDKYISLLTGSLSAIAKATVNHESIAQAISDALSQLDRDIAHWQERMRIHCYDKVMESSYIEISVNIFEMLADIFTSWSASRWDRFKHSFDNSYFDKKIQSKRDMINTYSQEIDRKARLRTEEHIFTNLVTKDELQVMMDQFQLQAFKLLEIGKHTELMLQDHVVPVLQSIERPKFPDAGSSSDPRFDGVATSLAPRTPKFVKQATQGDLQRLLSPYCQTEVQEKLLERVNTSVGIDFEVYKALEHWAKDPSSQFLWIEGPHDVERLSQNTSTSISLLVSARTTGIPTISHFCGEYPLTMLRSEFYSWTIVSLVYSLILQLWHHATSMTDSKFDQALSRLEGLDGTAASLPLAVALLKDLIKFRPPVMFCIIDSLQVVEDPGNRDLCNILEEVMSLFCLASDQRHVENGLQSGSEREIAIRGEYNYIQRIKTCFTTNGHVDVLGKMTSSGRLDKVFYKSNLRNTRNRERSDMSSIVIE